MKQNIYDNPLFFEGYQKLRDGDTGLNGAVEDPAIRSLLPSLNGLSVLDLGSGFGDFCRFARANGASSVVGVELSERMLEVARKRTSDGKIAYVHEAIEDFTIQPVAYDLIVSRMALHYVQDYRAVVFSIFRGLRSGGTFLCSVEHPICTALCEGWYENGGGKQLHWPVDDYSAEGERRHHWFVDGVIKHHRTVETYVNTVLDAGFLLNRLLEPHVAQECVDSRPDLKGTFRRPPILILQALKPTTTSSVTPPAGREARQP
jgi:2-polyprenyl-3-methyl-5-hydroxy-6-metoxy-1,4-benzoquinol methylase